MTQSMTRRALLGLVAAGAGTFAAPALLRAQDVTMLAPSAPGRHNIASYRTQRWQDHFQHLRKGAILCDLESRVLHYWSEDESIYLVYPSSVPMSEELTRRGYTEVVLKRRNPTWIHTPNTSIERLRGVVQPQC